MLKILLATDSEMLRYRLMTLIEEIPDTEIICSVSNVKQVLNEVKSLKPDVAIISFPKFGQSNARLAPTLGNLKPSVPVIALTTTSNYVDEWRRAGASYVFDLAFQLKEFCACLVNLSRANQDYNNHLSKNNLSRNELQNEESK